MKRSRRIGSLLLLVVAALTGSASPTAASQEKATTIGKVVANTSGRVWFFLHCANGDHWFGSPESGVYRHHEGSLTHFTQADGLPNDRVHALAEDAKGNVLIATAGGVTRFDGSAFVPLDAVDSTEWAMSEGDVWLKGNPNVNEVFRYSEGKLLRYRLPPHDLEAELKAKSPNPVADPFGLYSIYRDRSGAMWFGTGDRGVFRFDGKSLSWLYVDHLTNAPNGGSFGIRSILEDHAGNFWFCNTHSRFTIDAPSEVAASLHKLSYRTLPGIETIRTPDASNRIYFQSIVEDDAHHLWLLTYGDGIWRYDGKNLKHYEVRDGDRSLLLFAMSRDRDGTLWVATSESGIYRFDGTSFVPFRP